MNTLCNKINTSVFLNEDKSNTFDMDGVLIDKEIGIIH